MVYSVEGVKSDQPEEETPALRVRCACGKFLILAYGKVFFTENFLMAHVRCTCGRVVDMIHPAKIKAAEEKVGPKD